MFLQMVKIELPYDPEIPFLDTYPDKTMIGKDICSPVFIAALFTRHGNNIYPSTEEWIKKMCYRLKGNITWP